MKHQLLIPLSIILAFGLACSKIADVVNGPGNSGDRPAGNSGQVPPAAPSSLPDEFAPTADARADIERLADRFLSVPSFKATLSGEGTAPTRTELEFVAPDRYRIQMANGMNVIVIGKSTYMKIGDQWQRMELPISNAIGEARTVFNKEALRWISDVKYSGEEQVNGKPAYVYSYHSKVPNSSGQNESKMWIERSTGLPLKVEATYRSGALRSMTIDYDYSSPVTIEPPAN